MANNYYVEVTYRDTDAMGHLSSPVYYEYMQSAYLKYMWKLYGHGPEKKVPQIMVKTNCEYIQPVACNEELKIDTRIIRFGSKSFEIEYLMYRNNNDLVAKGKSVHVMFDYDKHQTLPVTDDFRERVANFQTTEKLAS